MLDELVALIGWDAMLAVSRAFGGQRLDVPYRCDNEHKIVKALGRDIADQLCDALGNTNLDIPIKFRREAEIRHLSSLRPKLTLNEIADRTMSSKRMVSKILARPMLAISTADRAKHQFMPRQMQLFIVDE